MSRPLMRINAEDTHSHQNWQMQQQIIFCPENQERAKHAEKILLAKNLRATSDVHPLYVHTKWMIFLTNTNESSNHQQK